MPHHIADGEARAGQPGRIDSAAGLGGEEQGAIHENTEYGVPGVPDK